MPGLGKEDHMRWQGRRTSSNMQSGGRGVRGGAAIGGASLILGLLALIITKNPFAAVNVALNGGAAEPAVVQTEELRLTAEEQELYEYSGVVLADTEDAWHEILGNYDHEYQEPKMLIFQDNIQSGCGIASSGIGPFYCGRDRCIYMDLAFYRSLIEDFGADEGDFILSYVISHEVGHHVQNELGILDQVHKIQRDMSAKEANEMSVRLELQADYLAGVVARYQSEQGYLEEGDIEDAISAAWVIGDDAIQKNARGYVRPESFTHGSSEQRARWYQKGYDAGDLSEFNTFDTEKYPTASEL